MNFRQWQHVRWSGSQHTKTPAEDAIKKIDTTSETAKYGDNSKQ